MPKHWNETWIMFSRKILKTGLRLNGLWTAHICVTMPTKKLCDFRLRLPISFGPGCIVPCLWCVVCVVCLLVTCCCSVRDICTVLCSDVVVTCCCWCCCRLLIAPVTLRRGYVKTRSQENARRRHTRGPWAPHTSTRKHARPRRRRRFCYRCVLYAAEMIIITTTTTRKKTNVCAHRTTKNRYRTVVV